MTFDDLRSTTGRKALAIYFAAWGLGVSYLALKGADWSFPIIAMVIFGLTLSGLAWLLTRRIALPQIAVAQPRREALGLLGYLAIYGLLFIGFGLGAVKALVPPGQVQELVVLAYKLLIHVVLPIAVIVLLGGAVRPILTGWNGGWRWFATLTVMAAVLFGLLALVSPSLAQIGEAGLSPLAALPWIAGAWLWVSIEAGLCEEFLFRAALQTRISAWSGSPVVAIVAVSLVFALAHWPGLYLRGGPGTDGWSTDPLQVAAFTIAALSPLSVLMGVLWERTRSLLLVALLHGAIDALPFTSEFVAIWR